MKTIKKTLSILFITAFSLFTSCGDEDDPTPVIDPTQATIDGLSKTWAINNVNLDDENVIGDWTGFVITFDQSKGYSCTNLSEESILVWPVSGSYTFPNANNPNVILRDDGVRIVIENLTESSVRLIFNIEGRRGGRTDGLIGEWVFNLTI